MKKTELKKLITCALIISTVASIGTIPAKATTTSDLYKQAYNATMKVIETGKEYNITPRHADNNTGLKSNKLDNIYKAVEEGNMQKAINNARECISKLSSNQWQAKNTFSNLLDGYQQPSYEHIVDVALQLNKLTKQDESKFENPTSWDENKKQEFRNTVKERQHYIEIARALNKGVDPTYGKTYSSALDKPQQTVINMVNVVVQDAKKSSKPSDIEFAESVVKAFKESVSENSNIKNYVTGLQKDMDSLVELTQKNKSALEAQAKEIEGLKEEVAKLKNESHKEDFEKEIKSLKGEIVNLKNNSSTIIPIPNNQEAIDAQAKLIKELQEQIKNGNPSNYEEYKKFTKRKQDEDELSNIEKDLVSNKKTIDNIINKKENTDIFKICTSLMGIVGRFNSIKSSSTIPKEELDNVNKSLINDLNRIYPSILEYLKMHNVLEDDLSGKIFYDNARQIYFEDIKKLNEMKLATKEYQDGIENKQLGALKKISESLKNITEDDQAANIKKDLNCLYTGFGGYGSSFKDIPKIRQESPIFPKLLEVCNQYVDTTKKFMDKAKNTKFKKDILIAMSSISGLANMSNIDPLSETQLQKITYDFADVSLDLKNTTVDLLGETQNLMYILKDDSENNNFYKLILEKFEKVANSEKIKDSKIAEQLEYIARWLVNNYEKTSLEHKKFEELENKLNKLANELQKQQQSHHEVITPSQGDKEHELEVEKQQEIQKLDNISNDIKNIKTKTDLDAIEKNIEKFSNKNLDGEVNNKYNLIVKEYMEILKQRLDDFINNDNWYTFYKINTFEKVISKNKSERIEIEDYISKSIGSLINSLDLTDDKYNLNTIKVTLDAYKQAMLDEGKPYNTNTYNNIISIYNDLVNKLIKNIKENKKYNLIHETEDLIESFKANELGTNKFYIEGEKLEKQLNAIKEKIEKDKHKQDIETSIEKK